MDQRLSVAHLFMLTTVGALLLSSKRGRYPKDAVFKTDSAAWTIVCSRSIAASAGKTNVMASLRSSEASLLRVLWLACITVTTGRRPGNHEKSSLASATDEAISWHSRRGEEREGERD